MNKTAERHLARARDYVERAEEAEEFYRKAAEEIMAAQTADPTLGTREIGEWFGRSHTWVQDIVRWHTSGKSTRGGGEGALPYSEQSGAVAKRHARSVLREAAPKEIEEIVSTLPPEAVERVAAATHKVQMETARKSPGSTEPTLADADYPKMSERFDAVRDNSTIEMAELFTALSRIRVKGVEKLVAQASAAERRAWVERLPDEIALLQLALDLCKTHKLQAVK